MHQQYIFLSHLFATTCFGRDSIIIRVLDIKKYSNIQDVHPCKIQSLPGLRTVHSPSHDILTKLLIF